MEDLKFTGYKISASLDLKRITAYFGLPAPESWKNGIVLEDEAITGVFRHKVSGKRIYIFEYGCIVFENFLMEEAMDFLEYFRLITGDLDYSLFARFYESHVLAIIDESTVSLTPGKLCRYSDRESLSGITAVVLARSVALSRIEACLDKLLDEAESFIKNLQKGFLGTNKRKYASIVSHILRFEFESALAVKVFDRPSEAGRALLLRGIYDRLAAYYELEDRYEILASKIEVLRNIAASYSDLRYHQQENRLVLFEVFLLILFPLSYFL